MKAKAILLASVLLVGCQSTGNVQQHAQSLSAAGQGEAAKFTSQARWMDDGTSIAPDGDLWAFIGDELKMGIRGLFLLCFIGFSVKGIVRFRATISCKQPSAGICAFNSFPPCLFHGRTWKRLACSTSKFNKESQSSCRIRVNIRLL